MNYLNLFSQLRYDNNIIVIEGRLNMYNQQDFYDYDEDNLFNYDYQEPVENEDYDVYSHDQPFNQFHEEDEQEEYEQEINNYRPLSVSDIQIIQNSLLSNQRINFSRYHHHHQEKIDNNIEPVYGAQMRISGLNYGVFDKQIFYLVDEGKRGYEFPNGGRMKFRKRHGKPSILEITDSKYYKIQIDVCQIDQIFNFPALKMICICSSFPPQYYISSHKLYKMKGKVTKALLKNYQQYIAINVKPTWKPFWKRIVNIPLHTFQQSSPNELIMSHILVKNGAIFLKLFQYENCLNNFREELIGHKQITQISQGKILLDQMIQKNYLKLHQQYSMAKFQKNFNFYPVDDRGKIEKFEIMFSLISLQNICNQNVTAKDIFILAEHINSLISHGKSIYIIWKALKTITSNDLEILKNKAKQQQLQLLLVNAISKVQARTKTKSFTQEEINQNSITVPLLKMTPSGLLPYGWSTDLRNRLVRHYRKMDHQFIKIEVLDDNFEKGSFGMFDQIFREQINRKMLKIQFFGRAYIPLGWTQSQLKNASMWFTLQSANCSFIKRDQLIYFLGDFSKIDNPALKAARMGQNLSTGFSISLKNVTVHLQKDDKSSKGHMYTDGIGMVSHDIVEKIQQKLNKTSTVYQIRFRGYKGLLALNRQLEPNTIVVRQSMKKFECPCKEAQEYLDILDCNYYKTGYLNRQIILLLQANKIDTSNFIELQREFIKKILNLQEVIDEEKEQSFQKSLMAKIIDKSVFEENQFRIENIGEILGKIKRQKIMRVMNQPCLRTILCEKYEGMLDMLVKKSRIKVEKSARILGIIDEFNILQENEVYCTISKKRHTLEDEQQEESENISGRVMVTRNPCMHPADIRVVQCVSKAEASTRFQNLYGITNLFQNLKNCVIFPKAGAIPLTSQISGSDLDGDQFFITWDQRLIPKNNPKPYVADQIPKQKKIWEGSDYPQILSFFTQFISNDNLGKIGNSHLAKADLEGPESPDCLKLCEAYNKAVDYPKKGYKFQFQARFKPKKYPHFMQKYDKKSYQSRTALGRVFNNAETEYRRFVTEVRSKKMKIKFIPAFLKKRYPLNQIKYALDSIKKYNEFVIAVLLIYKFDRESQLYALQKKKQNKDKISFLAKFQIQYFNLFFKNLPLEQKPQKYYQFMRETSKVLVQHSQYIEINKHIQMRILLWYHLINFNLLKNSTQNIEERNWIQEVKVIAKGMGINLDQLKKATGLLWFCIPTLTMIVLKMNKCYQYDA